MYTFVLEWTPALTPENQSPALADSVTTGTERATIPHGYIFAGFMVSVFSMSFPIDDVVTDLCGCEKLFSCRKFFFQKYKICC